MEVDASQFNNATPTDIIELIKQTLSGDNEKIKSATKILKAYTKHKSSISTLTFILVNSQQLGYRQMATILLKRNVVNLYGNLTDNQKKQFRDLLLSQYIKESHLLVQKGIATLISILLPIVQIKNWLQLQSLLDQAIRSAPESAATFVLLNSLLYHFTPPKQLYIYLFNALKIQKLVDQAIKCVNSVAQTQDIDPSFSLQLIKIWQQQKWGQQIGLQVLQILTTMCQRRFKLPDELTFWICDKIIGNRKNSNRLRTAGCDFLFSVADFYPKLITSKDSVLKKVVQTICLTCSQPHNYSQDQQKGEYVQQVALWLIQTLAITIKAKKIYPVLFQAATSLINSNDKNQVNTGFLILGAMCQGCSDKLKKNLQNPIMNVLIPRGLQHQEPQVRGAAINALCYFSEYLVPDIYFYHQIIVPSMLKIIGDLSPKVIQKALIALDVFLDGMQQQDIIQYLPIIIPKLTQVLVSQNSTSLMRAASMSGIGSAVTAAQDKFQPYVENILQTCNKIIQIPQSPQLNAVRAQNLNVLGKLANAFCKPEYKNSQLFYNNYIIPIMQKVFKILTNQSDAQMRQSCFAFFYLIANAIGSKFQIVFDNIIVEVLKGCKLIQPQKKVKNQFSLDSDSQDQGDAVHTNKIGYYDQKAAAIHALGQLARACPIKFIPYFQRAHQILQQNYQFFYDNIRIQVCHAYTNLTIGYIKSKNNGVLPKIKKGLPCIQRFTQQIQDHFRGTLIPRLIFMMTEDQDQRIRGSAVQSLDDLCKQLGPVLVDRSIEPIKDAIIKLLESDVAQQDSQQEQPEQDQDQTEVHTFQTICDLIPTLADNLRTGFQPTILQLHPYLMKFLQQRQDINDNVQMAGCLSQVFKFIPGYVVAHTQELFKTLAALINLWQTDINRNVAYCYAQMFQKASKNMMPYLQDGLVYLKQIFQHSSSSLACKQNAVGAICRIIYTYYPPMPYEIFVENLIKMVPYTGDEQQQGVALKCLLFLWNKNQNLLIPHKQRIIQVLQNDLSNLKKYNLQQPLVGQLMKWLTTLKLQ